MQTALKPNSTIREIKQLLATKQVSPQEVISFYHQRLQNHNATLNSALEIFPLDEIMRDISESSLAGILGGVPGIIKDNVSQKNRITSAASRILKNYRAPYESTISKRLKEAGGVSLGRANMDEFAMGGSGDYSAFGAIKNPWDLTRSPGGSSSGSAAAVAAGLAPWAIGTETGGSVRQPASFCGLVGLYPTYGRFSRFGILAFCSSTDQPGPLTRTVYDNALIASIMSGSDPYDATSLPEKAQDYTADLDGTLPEGIRIGVIKDAIESSGIDEEVRKNFEEKIENFKKMGAHIEYISLPNLKYGIAVYFILSRAEAASNLSRYDGSLYGMRTPDAKSLNDMYIQTRHDGFGIEVKRRIVMGNYVLSSGHRDAYYEKAQHVRNMIRTEYEDAFKQVDVLISPTASTLPFELGCVDQDPLSLYMADYFTVPNCITGLPALSIPGGFSASGLPIGFQFMGPRLSEKLLYKVAYAYEQNYSTTNDVPEQFK